MSKRFLILGVALFAAVTTQVQAQGSEQAASQAAAPPAPRTSGTQPPSGRYNAVCPCVPSVLSDELYSPGSPSSRFYSFLVTPE